MIEYKVEKNSFQSWYRFNFLSFVESVAVLPFQHTQSMKFFDIFKAIYVTWN